MTSQADQALLDRIDRFDKTERSIFLEQPATVISYVVKANVPQWVIAQFAQVGDKVAIRPSHIPVSAPQSEVEAILEQIPEPAPGPGIDRRELQDAINGALQDLDDATVALVDRAAKTLDAFILSQRAGTQQQAWEAYGESLNGVINKLNDLREDLTRLLNGMPVA